MSWVRYLTEVLGVRSVVLPAQAFALSDGQNGEAGSNIQTDPTLVRILFIGEPQPVPLLETEIFLKMLTAMKLESQDFQVWDLSAVDLAVREKDIASEWVVVSFSKKLSDWLIVQRPRLEIITTQHPLACERDPKLKRQVWEDLKFALEKSGLSTRLQS